MKLPADFKWPVAEEYEFYTTNEPDSTTDSYVPFPEERLKDYLRQDRDRESYSNDDINPYLFIAPSRDCSWDEDFEFKSLSDLRETNQNPVHVELLNLNEMDPLECFRFIDKWGMLGGGLIFEDVFYDKPITDSMPNLGELTVKPSMTGEMERAFSSEFQTIESYMKQIAKPVLEKEFKTQFDVPENDIPPFVVAGEKYFGNVFLDQPENHQCPKSWIRSRNHYVLTDFDGWESYGEWLWLPTPIYYPEKSETKSVFNFCVEEFRKTADQLNPFPFIKTDGNAKQHVNLTKKLQVSVHRQHTDGTNRQIDFRYAPRTLYDVCYLLLMEDGASKCLYCSNWNKGGNKFCKESHKTNFHSHKSKQTKNFEKFIKSEYPEILSNDKANETYPTRNDTDPYHPAELIPSSPLTPKLEPPRNLKPKELKIAKEWLEQLNKTSNRKDILKELIRTCEPEDL